MTTDAIYHKYWNALVDIEAVMVPQDAAIALALRLAIGDAYDAGGAVAADLVAIVAEQATPERSPADQRCAEQLQTQISRLNEWLQEHEAGLYISPGDTADAVLAALEIRDRRIGEWLVDMEKADSEVSDLRQQLTQMDADNADLTQRLSSLAGVQAEAARLREEIADLREQVIPDYQAELAEAHRLANSRLLDVQTLRKLQESVVFETDSNGNGVDPTTPPDWGRNHPAWQALPAAALGVIDQLSSGQTTFRRLDKSLRRDLVVRALRHLASEHGGPLPSSAWDRNRPLWLPTQGAVNMLSEGGNWSSLLAMALEPAQA